MFYRPKHFRVEEFVSKRCFKKWGQKAFWFMDAGLLRDLDAIREKADSPITINDWVWNGNYNASGLRQQGDEHYLPTSAHSFGKALDLKCKDLNSDQLRNLIIEMKRNGELLYISRIELKTQGWVHVDCFNAHPNDDDGLFYRFNP